VPEGDTVWRTALNLDRALTGSELVAADFRVPAHATLDLSGQQVVATVARGKHLLTRIGEGHTLHTHLRMEGAWHLYRTGTRWRRPAHEARVVLRTEQWTAVGFALGIVEVVARDAEDTVVGHLGPDLLGPDWDEDEALRRLLADPARPVAEVLDQRCPAGASPHTGTGQGCRREIGEALLDQTCLAGIGNLYKAETLFLSGVNPFVAVSEVRDLGRVVRLARRLMMSNKLTPMQSTTGVARRGEQNWVYGRGGRPCRRCGTRIRSQMQGPPLRERITYWCPACQP
jgi:endonuclease VIII